MADNLTITLKAPGQAAPTPPPFVPPPAPVLPPKKKRRWPKYVGFTLLGIVAAGAVFYGILFAYQKFTATPASDSSVQQSEQVVDKVSKLMLLPSETPTIAVSDLSKLQGQAFFANAHQGDIVLLYATAKEAILYSPSLNKIVQVAPITGNDQNAQAATTTQ